MIPRHTQPRPESRQAQRSGPLDVLRSAWPNTLPQFLHSRALTALNSPHPLHCLRLATILLPCKPRLNEPMRAAGCLALAGIG